MTPLDVISLADAKLFLKVDFDDDDTLITSLVYAAIGLVEQKTQYRLYQRIENEYSDGTYPVQLFQTPLNSVAVTTFDGAAVPYATIRRDPVRTVVCFDSYLYRGYSDEFNQYGASSLPLYTVKCDVGFANVGDIPVTLLQASKTLISYMYENRDLATTDIPSNVMMELTPFIRMPLF